jgi:hypothetical protein
MNKVVDILKQREFVSAEPAVERLRRDAPRAIQVILPVWGYAYVRQFLECGLPTLLAPGNIPALAAALPTEFVLLTSEDDKELVEQSPAFQRLKSICQTKLRFIDHLITEGNSSTTVTLAYTETVRAAGAAMLDTCFFFLVSDYIMADGSLASALKRMQNGASALVVGNFQVALEDAFPWLRQRLARGADVAPLTPRELMRWALNHLHPSVLANTVNIPFSHNSHTNRLFWRVDGKTILGRFYLMHMLCVRPEVTDFIIGASCDYSFVPEMCPSGNVEAMTDSDEYLVIEMQPRNHEAEFLLPGPLQAHVLAKSLGEWTTRTHRDNARFSVVFHAADLPLTLERDVAAADSFVAEVARRIKRAPLPYRNHPYWRGAIAAFKEATGRKLSEDEWRPVLGLPVSDDAFSQWLLWRAKYTLVGRPPHVLPWHPLWPDFQAVLREIEPFLTDPRQRMLMLSNGPTAFTLAFADSGERVSRFRCATFLQNFAERYEPLHRQFDICLVELSEGDMKLGGDLIDRIVPLMKDEGRIIVAVANRRAPASARGFASGVTFHGARFFRAGAVPVQFRFIVANGLRLAVRRGLFNLRTLTNRYPRLAVPAAIGGGGVLLFLSLLGNIDVLRRNRSMMPRGVASSFIMRMSIDRRQPEKDSASVVSNRASAASARVLKLRHHTMASANKAAESSRESQTDRLVELRESIGLTPLGLMTNQIWHENPRSLGFLLARYKFVAKMLSGRRNAAEVDGRDGFGTRLVLQEIPDLTVYDSDPVFIEDIHLRRDDRWPLKAQIHDIMLEPLPRKHDAVFSLDFIEHVSAMDEQIYLGNLRASLSDDGVLIIGTPSIESQAYASASNVSGHFNCKSGKALKQLLENYFGRVSLFSMNDEIVYTGYSRMADYLFVVCTSPK